MGRAPSMTPEPDARGGFENRPADWLSVAEAQARILGVHTRPGLETVPLQEALGRALAEDVRATALLPPWDNAAMDGFAVRAKDIEGAAPDSPVRLPVAGSVRAGSPSPEPLAPGTAIRIMTGAPLPAGADSVVRVEDTDGEAAAGTVVVTSDRDASRNVRPGGQDMRPGDLVLPAGRCVEPGVIAVLAATGRRHVTVRRRPSVVILTTGDELRDPDRFDDVIAGRGIPDTNGPMLAAAVLQAGGTPALAGIARDEVSSLTSAFDDVEDADVVVTVGGASMGEADLVKRVLDGLGLQLDFWRVTMRPGSPFGFGRLVRADRAQPVFMLPGNPASAFVTFELFVRPFLLALAGHRVVHRPVLRCRAGTELRGAAGLSFYARVTLAAADPVPVATPTGPQGSGLVRGLGIADGLALVPPDPGFVPAGADVDVLQLAGWERPGPAP